MNTKTVCSNSSTDEDAWREQIRRQTEAELDRRVREALETPPLERIQRARNQCKDKRNIEVRV